MTDRLFSKISEANKAYGLFGKDDKILVALSGGADSVSLILALKEYFPGITLYACHINHMIRGEDADKDCDFCRALCEKLGVTFDFLKADIPAMSKEKGLSTELTARNVRYAFFEEVCRKYGIKSVALAHTLSDNAETVLFNLTRGSALSGLCGIPPKRILSDDISIIRPLVFASREEIEEYLSLRNQGYVTDSTNLTDDYTRNYFRHRIIPMFKEVNPSFEESVGKMCISLRETDDFIKAFAQNTKTDSIYDLYTLDNCIQKEIILNLYCEYTGKTDIENIHICKISDLIANAATEKATKTYEVCLPGKISAIIKDGKLFFTETVRNAVSTVPAFNTKLVSGLNIIPKTGFAVYISMNNEAPETPEDLYLFDSAEIFLDSIASPLYARNRQNGDRITCHGMTKKLKELFNHKKIPTETRCLIPIIHNGEDILYVPGTAVNDLCTAGKHRIRIFIYSTTPQ